MCFYRYFCDSVLHFLSIPNVRVLRMDFDLLIYQYHWNSQYKVDTKIATNGSDNKRVFGHQGQAISHQPTFTLYNVIMLILRLHV